MGGSLVLASEKQVLRPDWCLSWIDGGCFTPGGLVLQILQHTEKQSLISAISGNFVR